MYIINPHDYFVTNGPDDLMLCYVYTEKNGLVGLNSNSGRKYGRIRIFLNLLEF